MARKKGTRRWTIAAIAVAILAAGGWTLIRGHSETRYRTAAVQRGNLSLTVSAAGTTNAVVTVQVGSQVSGNIQDLYADFNTRVKKGQLVARIDPTMFQARVRQAAATLEASKAAVVNAQALIVERQAEVASAEAAVAKAKVATQDAKLKWERRIPLLKDGVLAKEDLETAKATYDAAVASEQAAIQGVDAAKAQLHVAQTQLDSAIAQVKQSDAALNQAQTDLDHTEIRAPVDGVVVARQIDVGQTVAASLQAPTLFEIAQDLTKMQVDTNVSEADVSRVRVGQPATFTVDAYPGRIFHGTVREVRKAPINVQNVVTYDVVVAFDNTGQLLFPGMTANTKIEVGRREDVLRVPNAALRFRPPDAATPESGLRRGRKTETQTVWVLDSNGTPQAVSVTAGVSDGTMTEITGGALKEGERVVLAELAPGAPMSASNNKGGFGRRGPF
jgi:HlyD family secretion protein